MDERIPDFCKKQKNPENLVNIKRLMEPSAEADTRKSKPEHHIKDLAFSGYFSQFTANITKEI